MDTIKNLNLPEFCTGCAACYNVCPVHAINMQLDDEGFYFPKIDEKVCIGCGLCKGVCYIGRETSYVGEKLLGGSFVGSDEVRKKSSSGGLFYYLAHNVMEKNGVVFGAAFDPHKKAVVHVSTDDISLERIMRSKYVQSSIGDCYTKVKSELIKGREVCFCGTPCQVYGLRRFLNKEYDNLLTVDFKCHGVPSAGFFKDVLDMYEKNENSNVTDVTFREKDYGWRTQVVKIYFDNNKIIEEFSRYYYYYYAFLQNITLRKSCYTCHFPEHHAADITLFDYWNVSGDDNGGVSAFFTNTKHGQTTMEELRKTMNFKYLDASEFSDIAHYKNRGYRKKIMRKSFFEYYKKHGIEQTCNCFLKGELFICKCIGKVRAVGGKIKIKLKGR